MELINRNELLKAMNTFEPIVDGPHDTFGMLEHAQWEYGCATVRNAPGVAAYTAEQVSEIIRQAEADATENGTLRTGLEFLKDCINCKIRNTCPRHCGKVVHGCDHWEYGDPVAHGRWTRYSASMMECSACGRHTARHRYAYCPHCGARMED